MSRLSHQTVLDSKSCNNNNNNNNDNSSTERNVLYKRAHCPNVVTNLNLKVKREILHKKHLQNRLKLWCLNRCQSCRFYQIIFQAYDTWVNEHGEEYTLPDLKYNNKQLFFLGYAQVRNRCSLRDRGAVLEWIFLYLP